MSVCSERYTGVEDLCPQKARVFVSVKYFHPRIMFVTSAWARQGEALHKGPFRGYANKCIHNKPHKVVVRDKHASLFCWRVSL